jgi:hypothetical protein
MEYENTPGKSLIAVRGKRTGERENESKTMEER